jgi:hypothetical protein
MSFRAGKINFSGLGPYSVARDASIHREYYLSSTQIDVFGGDVPPLLQASSIRVLQPPGTFVQGSLVRWGYNGLAYLNEDDLVILRSLLVKP